MIVICNMSNFNIKTNLIFMHIIYYNDRKFIDFKYLIS